MVMKQRRKEEEKEKKKIRVYLYYVYCALWPGISFYYVSLLHVCCLISALKPFSSPVILANAQLNTIPPIIAPSSMWYTHSTQAARYL